MTIRQYLLKLLYPIIALISGLFKNKIQENKQNLSPTKSFYTLSSTLINGEVFNFESLRGYKVLIVNTASDCGFTAQYAELEELYQKHKGNLKIIAFPANDFKDQEKENNENIAIFCKKNYGVSFILMQKTKVIGNEQNSVFKWLTNKNINGWCSQQPEWNFSKYLVNENGDLQNYFASSLSPLSNYIIDKISVIK